MKSSRKFRFCSSSSSTTVTYAFENDHPTPQPRPTTKRIPIESDVSTRVPITVRVHSHTPLLPTESAAAVKIQSAYRSHVVRVLVKKIVAVNSEANRLERLIQRQETVDAIRRDDREKVRMNEALMSLLLRLDSVPGFDPAVREFRRSVSRRIVGLQEILDSISEARVDDWYGLLRDWDDAVAEIEEDVCKERGGGEEMERFCAEKLGFRCLQRFLRDP